MGTPVASRSRPGLEQVSGLFLNTVVLRSTIDPAETFRAHLARVRGVVLDGLANQDVPFEKLVEELEPERDPARSPFFQALLVAQRADRAAEVTFPGLVVSTLDGLTSRTSKFDMSLYLTAQDDALEVAIEYNTDLFDAATIARLATHYGALLEHVLADAACTIAQLPQPASRTSPASESAAQLLERLRAADIRLSLDGDRLRVSAPKGAMTAALRAAVAESKQELVAALRTSADAGEGPGPRHVIRRIPRDGPLPLSSVQQRLWFIDRMGAGDVSDNVGGAFRIRGRLDADAFRRAIEQLVHRHESLRTRICEHDGAPSIEIADAAGASLEEIDVSHLSAQARDEDAFHLVGERLRARFDVANGPLSGYRLVRLAPDEHAFALSVHHVAADGWSAHIALREIFAIYQALCEGKVPSLAALPIEYVDYAGWEQEQLQSGRMRRHLNFWKEELAGAPQLLELPTDRPRPSAQSWHGCRSVLELDAGLLEPLKQLSRQHEATLFMTLVATLQVLLHRYSGQDDVVIGSPMASRVVPELEGIIGCFVNNLVLRGRVGGNPSFAEILARTRQTTLGAFDHKDLPFDLIVDGVRPDRGANHAPIFQVMLSLSSFPATVPLPPGFSLEAIPVPGLVPARTDLTLDITELEGRFFVSYLYASDLFDAETIERMHSHFGRLLRAVVTDPSCPVQELPLLDSAEEQLLLDEWNDTAFEHDRGRCLHGLFEAAARATPDATAVSAGSARCSYRELDERANRLAQLLARRGVEPGSLVAVCVDRTIDMVVSLAAVLKAGAAYVPLDPTHPAERLRYTLEDAAVSCAITLGRFAPLLGGTDSSLVLLDEAEAELSTLPASAPAVTVKPVDRAYVIYTSGSTGRPKGVEVEHRNVVALLEAMRRKPGFEARDVLLAVTTLSFDIAGLELWLPLVSGGRAVIASRTDVLDGERLIGLIEEHRVTVMQATPATWRLMLDAGWAGKRDLKVLCGGEELPRDLAAALIERVPRTLEHVWPDRDHHLVHGEPHRGRDGPHHDRSPDRQHPRLRSRTLWPSGAHRRRR